MELRKWEITALKYALAAPLWLRWKHCPFGDRARGDDHCQRICEVWFPRNHGANRCQCHAWVTLPYTKAEIDAKIKKELAEAEREME